MEQLKPFKNHPFQVRDDEEFRRLVESIEIHGVIHPAVARQIGEDCILSEKKPNQREPMIVEEEEIKQYFPSHYNSEQMHNTILLLIRNWSKKRGYTQ